MIAVLLESETAVAVTSVYETRQKERKVQHHYLSTAKHPLAVNTAAVGGPPNRGGRYLSELV